MRPSSCECQLCLDLTVNVEEFPVAMAEANPYNVYKGQDGLRKYFDPDAQPPLPLVELPAKLNPFAADGVRIYAKMLTVLPAQNVKALPGKSDPSHEGP